MSQAVMADTRLPDPEAVLSESLITPPPQAVAGLDIFADVPLTISFELASCSITTGELLGLCPGARVSLGPVDVDSVQVRVEGDLVGSGEITLCDDVYGIRITTLGDCGTEEHS